MRYQKIESKIWNDEKFILLTPEQQRLFFYILTCPHGNLMGLYVLKSGYASDDLKVLRKDFEKSLLKLINLSLISYDFETSVILVHNFLKHNPITNPNQRKAIEKQLVALPKTQLIQKFKELNPSLAEDLPEVLWEVLSKPETETDSVKETEPPLEGPPRGTNPSEDFEKFWKIYPNKRGGKEKAWEIWKRRARDKKLPPFIYLMECIHKLTQDEYWTREDCKYVPHLTTFLNQGRWSDVEGIKKSRAGPTEIFKPADPNCPECKGKGVVPAVKGGKPTFKACKCRRADVGI